MNSEKVDTPAAAGQGVGAIREATGAYFDRVRGGEFGSLPAVLGLVSLIALFTILEGSIFFSTYNFANLIQQSAMIIVVAMGLVFVLLLGEIDLAAGYAAACAGAILAVTLTEHGWPWPLAILACLAVGLLIGLLTGLVVAELRIPSFVVTLATFLALNGLLLIILGDGGSVAVTEEAIVGIQNNNMPLSAGWALAAISVGGWALISGRSLARRRAAGLTSDAPVVWMLKLAVLATIAFTLTFFLSRERSKNIEFASQRGIPYVVPLLLLLLLGLTFVLTRTRFGRHVYAVGGNAEAARRAGIDVKRVRLLCFIACSVLAAVAGILFAAKDRSISATTGGSRTLLDAVGAAVIGGTSLFGGRGRIADAVIGGLVIGVIANGLPLVTQNAGIQFVVTGLVLLVAASVDALSRRRSSAT